MRLLSFVLVVLFSMNSGAWEQFWSEDREGVTFDCYKPGFFSGETTCKPWKGKIRPTRAELKIKDAPPEIAAELKTAGAEVSAASDLVAAEEKALEQNLKELRAIKPPETSCDKVAVSDRQKCFKDASIKIDAYQTKLTEQSKRTTLAQDSVRRVKGNLDSAIHLREFASKRADLVDWIRTTGTLQMKLDKIEGKLQNAQLNLDAVEKAYESSILEAYVYQKMQKMAANMCDYQKQCPAGADKTKEFMKKIFEVDRIERDATGTSQSAGGTE